MKIAFVGVKRKYRELPKDYIANFNQYHLELPHYYARDGGNDVTITTVDYSDMRGGYRVGSKGWLDNQQEKEFIQSVEEYDVVIHWRKWHPELYRPEAINVINCQDHSFSTEWNNAVKKALDERKLYGILCFPEWHKKNLQIETGFPIDRLIDGITLGVDIDIYKPSEYKDQYRMLWASDPGRGINEALNLALNLWSKDKRFKMDVCWPDYVNSKQYPAHPVFNVKQNLMNGPELWNTFNEAGILPYTSCFPEPSSRAHRQAQAAGALVLYPPNMGTPSDLIESGKTGIVAPIKEWVGIIKEIAGTEKHKEIGKAAREFAISENWGVQAQRFNSLFEKIIGERK